MSDIVPLLKFTPSAQDPVVLETITVQRQPLIARLVDVALDADSGARHQLLVGPRGIGKTHILSLVASRLRAEAASGEVVLAWLDEDPWSITSYEKFLAAVIAQVAGSRSDQALEERSAALRAGRDKSGREAEEVLRDAVGESRLVLLAENLDEIFRRIGANGQERFRAFAEDWQQMLILATSPQLFEGIQLHESPFYGFFAITHLDELSLDSATELMRRVALLRGDEDLIEFLGTDVARHRIAAIEALAGGHPRIWLLLSGCVSIKAIDDLVPLFLEALDELTPYYQDRLRELGDQQQELVVLLGEAGGALSNRALSERSGIAQNQIATMLRQLTGRGYVRRAEVPAELASGDARMSFWELREPLMRLCLDVKQARGKPLRMVVEFLRAWYGPRLLDELAILPSSAQLATSYVSEAFRTFDEVLPPAALFRGSSEEIVARAELGLSLTPERLELRFAKATGLLMDGRVEQARDELEALISDTDSEELKLVFSVQLEVTREALGEPANIEPLVAGLLELSDTRPDDALALGLVAIGLSALDRYEEAIEVYPRAIERMPDDPMLLAGYVAALAQLDRDEEVLEVLERMVALDPGSALVQGGVGVTLRQLGHNEKAVAAFERAIELDPENTDFANGLGNALGGLGRFEEALRAFERGIDVEPDDASLHVGRGFALQRLGLEREALEAISHAAELAPEVAYYKELLGSLASALGHPDLARAAYSRALELDPESVRAKVNLGAALSELGREDDAFEEFEGAAELDPENPLIQRNIGALLNNTGRFEAAEAAFRNALSLDPADPRTQHGLSAALLNLGRYEESLEGLRQAAAADPTNAEVWAQLAAALKFAGHLEQAREAFVRATELDPSNARHRNEEADLLRRLGQFDEAEAAINAAIAADGREPIYHFTASEISLSRGDEVMALAQLREALTLWGEAREVPPGEPELLCEILWDRNLDDAELEPLVSRLVSLYREFDAAEDLGRGAVASIAWMADPKVGTERADSWVAAWLAAPEVDDLTIPMRLLRAAAAWKRDRDRAHLLDLPAEQREILVGLLEGEEASPA